MLSKKLLGNRRWCADKTYSDRFHSWPPTVEPITSEIWTCKKNSSCG